MERNIDMGQTVEEAAKEYIYKARASFVGITPEEYEEQINPEYPFNVGTDRDFESIFIAGAEWQAKKFPWISTKDKLPDDEDLVITGCWCTDYFKYLQQGWYCRECNEWYDTNGDKICVTHWMPILDLRNSINRAFP